MINATAGRRCRGRRRRRWTRDVEERTDMKITVAAGRSRDRAHLRDVTHSATSPSSKHGT